MPTLADALGTAAEYADVTGHRLHCRRHAVVLLAISIAPRSPGGFEGGWFGAGIHIGQLLDICCRYATNRLGPFRGLWYLIVGAEDVILETLLIFRPLRHRAGIHALTEFVDEFLILQVVGKYVVRHAGEHRRIGIRADGNPPRIVGGGGIGVLRIDDDKFAATLLGQPHVIEGVTAMKCVGRVPTPHDDQLAGSKSIVLIAIVNGAEGHVRRKGRPLITRHRPGVGPATEHAKKARQQSFDLVRLVQHAIRTAGIGLIENGCRPVLLLQLHHFAGDVVQRLVPRNALELALATFADAHHRVEQTFRRIEP